MVMMCGWWTSSLLNKTAQQCTTVMSTGWSLVQTLYYRVDTVLNGGTNGFTYFVSGIHYYWWYKYWMDGWWLILVAAFGCYDNNIIILIITHCPVKYFLRSEGRIILNYVYILSVALTCDTLIL